MKSLFFGHQSNERKRAKARLSMLDAGNPKYVHVKELFERGWLHPSKPKPFIHSIFEILATEAIMEPYHKYLNGVRDAFGHCNDDKVQKLLFHGTVRKCALVESPDNVRLCGAPRCPICCIVEHSFNISKCGSRNSFSRFGVGIYTSPCSSKADDYVANKRDELQLRVLVASHVVVGEPCKRTRNCTDMVCPPHPYHSVLGIPGEDLNYEETVVYLNDAIRPSYLITYGRPPETKKRKSVKSLFVTPLVT